MSICICGDPNPMFKGYCENCIRKLKEKFDKILIKREKLTEELDNFNGKD